MEAHKHLALIGCRATDRVTGLKGFVNAVSFDLYGCVQADLHLPAKPDGMIPDGRWLDVNRLVDVEDMLSETVVPLTVEEVRGHLQLLGWQGEDIAHGMMGVATSVLFGLDRKVNLYVAPSVDNNGAPRDLFCSHPLRFRPMRIRMPPLNFEFGLEAEGLKGPEDKPRST